MKNNKCIQLKRVLKYGIVNLMRNKIMFVASVLVTAITMMVIGACYIITQNINRQIELYVDEEYSLTIFLNEDIDDKDAEAFSKLLQSDSRVKSFVYKSKEAAFRDYEDNFPDDSFDFIFEGKDQDFLPVSFDIVMNNNEDTQLLINDLQVVTYSDLAIEPGENIEAELCVVREFSSTESLLGRIESMKNIVYGIGVVLTGLLMFFAVVIIANTIMLSVFARKTEIEIMNHIGATKRYIVGPYIVEGCIIGGIGALIAYFILQLAYMVIMNAFNNSTLLSDRIKLQLVEYGELSVVLIVGLVLTGIIIGSVGAVVSAGRNVKN